MANGFLHTLNRFADYRDISRPSIHKATIAVTERYARRVLKLRKREPMVYRGLALTCIGSPQWRLRQ